MPPKSRSDVWKYFLKLANNSAQCKFCAKVLKTSGNTTNLKGHLNIHKKQIEEGAQDIQVNLMLLTVQNATCNIANFIMLKVTPAAKKRNIGDCLNMPSTSRASMKQGSSTTTTTDENVSNINI